MPATVLMYHRINNTATDPWNISVTPRYFEEQIRFLKNNFNVISVADLITEIKQNRNCDDTICITFDDGYADNFINAKPVLENYECPSTFFIPTSFVDHKFFWWDTLENVFLFTKRLPYRLHIQIGKTPHNYLIREPTLTSQQFSLHQKWRWYDKAPTTRCVTFLQIWKALQPLHTKSIEHCVNEIKQWAEVDGYNDPSRNTMDWEQLRVLCENELFTLGLHTHTHTSLRGKSETNQLTEIVTCKDWLQNALNITANMLAYPYGQFDDVSIGVAKKVSLDACFTTTAGIVNNKSNYYSLCRLQVGNWSAYHLLQQLTKLK